MPFWGIPNDLIVGWSFTAEWLAEAMPTLGTITYDALAERRVPSARPVVASEVLCTVAAVAGPRAIPLLDRFAHMNLLHPEVREQAILELRVLRGT